MLQRLPAALLAMISTGISTAADTPAADFTRTKRLPARVTFSAKEKPLKALLDEICDQLENQKLGRLRFELAASGLPTLVTLDVNDLPLSEALARARLGFAVISSDINPKDGWVKLVKADAKLAGPPATAEEERDAKLKLDTAKKAIKNGVKEDARFLLKFIVKKYPMASVVGEAKSLLETLEP